MKFARLSLCLMILSSPLAAQSGETFLSLPMGKVVEVPANILLTNNSTDRLSKAGNPIKNWQWYPAFNTDKLDCHLLLEGYENINEPFIPATYPLTTQSIEEIGGGGNEAMIEIVLSSKKVIDENTKKPKTKRVGLGCYYWKGPDSLSAFKEGAEKFGLLFTDTRAEASPTAQPID